MDHSGDDFLWVFDIENLPQLTNCHYELTSASHIAAGFLTKFIQPQCSSRQKFKMGLSMLNG